MVVFRDKAVFKRAAAWHDHGHENNPSVPRWEDTRSSSGFNYRMMELQGAIGLAQLRKLSSIVAKQRENKAAIWSALADLTDLKLRAAPDGAFDTADALIFMAKNSDIALKIRTGLVDAGLATKILPEAYSWHFAGTWAHMPELIAAHGGNLKKSFEVSHSILSRAVSLPVGVSLPTDAPSRIRTVIERVLT
jgi:8-amino-3,8-dideoxy-alpha-D-manno-octulosonate transaminase